MLLPLARQVLPTVFILGLGEDLGAIVDEVVLILASFTSFHLFTPLDHFDGEGRCAAHLRGLSCAVHGDCTAVLSHGGLRHGLPCSCLREGHLVFIVKVMFGSGRGRVKNDVSGRAEVDRAVISATLGA